MKYPSSFLQYWTRDETWRPNITAIAPLNLLAGSAPALEAKTTGSICHNNNNIHFSCGVFVWNTNNNKAPNFLFNPNVSAPKVSYFLGTFPDLTNSIWCTLKTDFTLRFLLSGKSRAFVGMSGGTRRLVLRCMDQRPPLFYGLFKFKQTPMTRDGFRERGALGHLSFWGPTQVWPIWL